jgi:nickel/cobalt exporter
VRVSTPLGILATAGVLGVTHALEPDHVAGIYSLTGQYGDSRLSAVAGVCFSLGHVALVVGWLVVAYLLLGATTFPPVLDTLGSLAVVVVLGGLGAVLTIRGVRGAMYAHAHAHGDHSHSEPHLHLPVVGGGHDHDHTTRAYLRTGLVGALFTLSPPASMIAFSATILPEFGPTVVGGAAVAYAIGITLTMGAIGASAGSVSGRLQANSRLYGIARAVAGVLVLGVAAYVGIGASSALF